MAKRETLRELLDRLALHPDDVAEEAGISRSTLYKWLKGDSAPKPWRRADLAKALGVEDDVVRKALDETARRES